MDIFKSVLLEAADDDIGLWAIQWKYCDYGRDPDIQTARKKTLKLIEELLVDGLIQAGMFTEEGDFELWNLSPVATLARTVTEWDKLESDPSIGDIVYFTATEKGQQVANTLQKA